MPDEGVIVTMLSHTLGMSRDRYVLTRTREQFSHDVQGLLKSQLMSMEVLSSMFGGEDDGSAKSVPPPDMINPGEDLRNADIPESGNHWDKAGPEMSDRAC